MIDNTNFQLSAAFSDIFFEPPDPKTYINNVSTISPLVTTDINIVLKGQACTAQNCTTVTISTAGTIDITN